MELGVGGLYLTQPEEMPVKCNDQYCVYTDEVKLIVALISHALHSTLQNLASKMLICDDIHLSYGGSKQNGH